MSMTTQTLPTGMKQLKLEDLVINTIVSNDPKSRSNIGITSVGYNPNSYQHNTLCKPGAGCWPHI